MRWVVFSIAAVVIFTVFVTVFAASAKKTEVRNLPKWLWIVLCLFVPVAGGVLYLILGRPNRGGSSVTKTRTVAPDDDPQFLRDLSQRLNEDENKKKKQDEQDDSGEEAPKS
jgi:hypothetical protein